jgi:hypothetical protein
MPCPVKKMYGGAMRLRGEQAMCHGMTKDQSVFATSIENPFSTGASNELPKPAHGSTVPLASAYLRAYERNAW